MAWTSTRFVDTPNRQDCPCQKERVSCPRCERMREFRESAVGLVLSEGLSIRRAAGDLGMLYNTLHGWVRAARRSRRKPVQKVQPRTEADAEARVCELEAEVRK